MFDKIVLATDLSTDWDHVIGCAEDLRALGATQAVLTHVLVTRGLVGAGDVPESEARPKLKEQRGQLELQGFEVTFPWWSWAF